MPLAGAFAASKDEALASPRHPLEWRWCRRCGLVNVWPELAHDYADYSYRASDVPALRAHHHSFAKFLTARYAPEVHIEIGGNDGVLASQLPWDVINVDPSDAFVGPGVNEAWTSDLARNLPRADLITSSNSFAHFAGIDDALKGVRWSLKSGGTFILEAHDLDATLDDQQWDTVYHEHHAEWSAASLTAAGALHGLRLTDLYRLPLHGGLLRAVFALDRVRKPKAPERPDFGALQHAYDTATAPPLPAHSVAYGAAARATVYLDHVRPPVDFVVDGSPRRAGRFVPGVGLPVRPPEEMGDPPAVLITAWPHAEDIKAQHPDYQGRWVTAW